MKSFHHLLLLAVFSTIILFSPRISAQNTKTIPVLPTELQSLVDKGQIRVEPATIPGTKETYYSVIPTTSDSSVAAKVASWRQVNGRWEWTSGTPGESKTVWTPAGQTSDPTNGELDTAGQAVAQKLSVASGAGNTPALTEKDITKFLTWVASQAIKYVLVIAAIFIILAGYIFITSLGNTTKVEQAKNMLLYTIIGILVVLGAYLAVNAILAQIGAS